MKMYILTALLLRWWYLKVAIVIYILNIQAMFENFQINLRLEYDIRSLKKNEKEETVSDFKII